MMDILRIANAARDRAGAQLNKFWPPRSQVFRGQNKTGFVIALVARRWEYGSRLTGDGFEYRRFLPALCSLASEVHFIPTEARGAITSSLRNIADRVISQHKPVIAISVFQTQTDIPDDYFKLAGNQFFLANWYTDDDMYFQSFSSKVAANFQLNVTTYEPNVERYHTMGWPALLSQWGGISGLTFLNRRKYLACFIGRMYGGRKTLARRLKRTLGEDVFIHDTRLWPLNEGTMLSVYQNSWIAIDEPMAYDGITMQIKARIFENPSMGCVVLTRETPRLSPYFNAGKEILFYSDIDHLLNIVKNCRLNTKDYKEMAYRAYDRVTKEHLYVHRFARILQSIERIIGAS